jgi:hypothetical protein
VILYQAIDYYLEVGAQAYSSGQDLLGEKMIKAAVDQASESRDALFLAKTLERTASLHMYTRKDAARAKRTLTHALYIYSDELGWHAGGVALILTRLAVWSKEQGHLQTAIKYWKRALHVELAAREPDKERLQFALGQLMQLYRTKRNVGIVQDLRAIDPHAIDQLIAAATRMAYASCPRCHNKPLLREATNSTAQGQK